MRDTQQQDFQARLSRLGAASASQTATSADNVVAAAPVKSARFQATDDSFKARLAYPASIAWSFVFGLLSVFLARFVLAHLGGAPENTEPMSQYLIDLGIAGATLFAVSIALGTVDKVRSSAGTLGLFISVTTMHNLFWMYPEFFSMLYGAEWVDALLGRSIPSSLYFKGQYIPIE